MITIEERKRFIEENRDQYTPERLLEVVSQLNRDRAMVSSVPRVRVAVNGEVVKEIW